MKKIYLFTIEFFREIIFAIILGILLFFVASGSTMTLQDTFYQPIGPNEDAGNIAYNIQINKELFDTEKDYFNSDNLAYVATYTSSVAPTCYIINDIALTIFNIPYLDESVKFTKSDQNDTILEAMVVQSLAKDYPLGSITTFPHTPSTVQIVGYIEENYKFHDSFYNERIECLIVNHIKIKNLDFRFSQLYLVAPEGVSAYMEKFYFYECKISSTTVAESIASQTVAIKQDNARTLFMTASYIAMLLLTILLYSFCKNDLYAKKYAVYNIYGETKLSRFTIEFIKTIIIALVPFIIYCLQSLSSIIYIWNIVEIVSLIVATSITALFIIINTIINTQILRRHSKSKIE